MEFKQNSVKFEGKFRDFAIFPMKMLVKNAYYVKYGRKTVSLKL
jgi:hypothetical protein